jgi:hypothetical protein
MRFDASKVPHPIYSGMPDPQKSYNTLAKQLPPMNARKASTIIT